MIRNREMIDHAQKQAISESKLEKFRREARESRERELHKPQSEIDEEFSREVEKVMSSNELDKATIIFSQNAITLFTHMFGNSMEQAVQKGIRGIETTIERVVQTQLASMISTASQILENHIQTLTKSVSVEDIVLKAITDTPIYPSDREGIINAIIPPRNIRTPKTYSTMSLDELKGKDLGNAKNILDVTAPLLLDVYKRTPNVPLALKLACKTVENEHGIRWKNPTHTVRYLQSLHKSFEHTGHHGQYIYREDQGEKISPAN